MDLVIFFRNVEMFSKYFALTGKKSVAYYITINFVFYVDKLLLLLLI
jgi:hypothetical protein